MTLVEIEETITVSETPGRTDLDITVEGELTLSAGNYATPTDVHRARVQTVSRALASAIDDVIEQHAREVSDE